jgi:hypothetical protein
MSMDISYNIIIVDDGSVSLSERCV